MAWAHPGRLPRFAACPGCAHATSTVAAVTGPMPVLLVSSAAGLCAGVPLPYIRDILGHVDLSTTEIYARVSTQAKRTALEVAYPDIVTTDQPEWNHDPKLLDWLNRL